jgi:hypothetical protein
MANDKNIFGPRSSTVPELRPTRQQVTDFLDGTLKEKGGARQSADVVRYLRLLFRVERYEKGKKSGGGRDAGERMLLEALSRSGFVNDDLLFAVGEYKFHMLELVAMDFTGPEEFIRFAEIKRAKLSKKKIGDVERMIRLDEMVAERKRVLAGLGEQWTKRSGELRSIARYVKDNLARVALMCRRCIGVIAEHETGRKVEGRLVEDLKEKFRSGQSRRKATGPGTEKAGQEADEAAAALRRTITVDLFRMAGTFEAVHEHANRIAGELGALLDEYLLTVLAMDTGTVASFRRIERALVALVADFPAQLDRSDARAGAADHALIEEQRQIMLDRLFADLQRERRERKDRRERADRRREQNANYSGPERRSGGSRRKKKERRG